MKMGKCLFNCKKCKNFKALDILDERCVIVTCKCARIRCETDKSYEYDEVLTCQNFVNK